MNLSGFSAVNPGYSAQESATAETQRNQSAAQEAAYKLLGAQVLGRALTGGQAPQPQPSQPMAPPPGQASVPNQPQMPQGMPNPMMQGGMAPPPGQGSMPMRPPMQPAQGPAGAPVAQGGGGMPEISLQALTQRIIQTTPQVQQHPEILMAALERAAPLLDRQSRDDLADMRRALQEQRLQAQSGMLEQRLQAQRDIERAREEGRNRRGDQTSDDRRYGADRTLEGRKYTADTLLRARELSNEARRDIAQLSNETRREIAARAEIGKQDRAELSAAARREIATLNAETRREVVGMMEAGRERRSDQASEDRRYATDERSAVAREAEAGRGARATEAEGGRMRRAEMSLETKAAMQRLSQAAREELETQRQAGADRRAELSAGTRRELASQSIEARQAIQQYLEGGRNERAALSQQGQTARADERNTRTDRRLDQADTREARLTAAAAVRQDQGYQRLQLQLRALEDRAAATGDKNLLTQWRVALDAQHKRAQEIIQANSVNSALKPADKKALLAEQDASYNAAIADMKSRMAGGQPAAPAAPAPAPGAPSAPAAAPAPAPVSNGPPPSALKSGIVTTFANGQKWTLGPDGQPKQVQ